MIKGYLFMPKKTVNDNLRKVIEITYEMLELADHGDKFRQDSGCGVVYGTLRDEAYKLRRLAEEELLQHGRKSKTTSRRSADESGLANGAAPM
jgi:hypothetical protein